MVLAERPRGLHLITAEVIQAAPPIRTLACGLLHVFIQHTSASLTINENADPDVRHDLNRALDTLAPESGPYTHVCEGPDDMPAHIKCALMGTSLSVPIHEGRLALGTWQGIYLGEHRDQGGPRRLLLTVAGSPREGG